MIIPVVFSPIWSSNLIRLKLERGSIRFSDELGRELKCTSCSDFLPADTEFFNSCKSKPTGLNSWCRACYSYNRFGDK